MDTPFLQERITAIKSIIVVYEEAVYALLNNKVQSYTLDTGQNRQTVTRLDIASLQGRLDGMYNTLATMQARLSGSGVVHVRPAW